MSVPRPPYFWRWVREVLAWPFIRTPGPLACVVEACARAADDVLADVHWLRDQFNPATCEDAYVDRYGAARGLTRHHKESAAQWRRRVCAAMAWHKLAGRTLGMPQILAHYGYTGGIMCNLAAEGAPERWAHFRAELVTGDYPVTDADWELIRWVLNSTKPAKSVLENITIVVQARLITRIAVGQISGEVTTIAPWAPRPHEGKGRLSLFAGRQEWETTTIQGLK